MTSDSMRAKANNPPGFNRERQTNSSNDRGYKAKKSSTEPRYVVIPVIVSVIFFVTVILSDLRYTYIPITSLL